MKTKSVFLIAIFSLSLLIAPQSLVNAQEETGTDLDDIDPQQMEQILGSLFGMFRGFGASGEMLAQVFEMMFNNFRNMSATESEEQQGLYMLNASLISDPVTETYNYNEEDPRNFYPWGVYNLKNSGNETYEDEYPYLQVDRNGLYNVTSREGVSLTFIIWDWDGSFITAIDRILTAIQRFAQIEESQESDESKVKAAVSELVSAVTYFLIHINDIITGDEIIILNTIAFTEYELEFTGYGASCTWYHTEDGEATDNLLLENTYEHWKVNYTSIATELDDQYMLWLLEEEFQNTKTNMSYTKFSFDIIQIWLKNFEVHIDVEAIFALMAEGQQAIDNANEPDFDGALGETAPEDIFQGLDIEFYIFTHHFSQFVLFDDTKFDDPIYSQEVQALANNGVPDVIRRNVGSYENETVDAIVDSEVTHHFQLRGSEFSFDEPVFVDGNLRWGFTADNLEFRAIPMGMNPDDISEEDAPIIKMETMKLGFTFIAEKDDIVDSTGFTNASGETTMGSANVKLLSEFGRMDNASALPPSRDLSMIFMSTILHVHLNIENKRAEVQERELETNNQALMGEENYNTEEHRIKVGDYTGDLPLAEIDIAGPFYEQYENGPDEDATIYNASTNIIPAVYASVDARNRERYQTSNNDTNVVEGMLTVEFSVLIYAVSYPTFGSSGDRIVHDPTFSIYLTFTSPAFWAAILVFGSVILVGVAAAQIAKKRERAVYA